MIQRIIANQISQYFFKGKCILLMGPRQVGKTTLIKKLIEPFKNDAIWMTGEESQTRSLLENPTRESIELIFGKNKILVIDEAQEVHEIGRALKLIVDFFPERQVIATGSSSFELANKTQEPLTGRKYEFQLFPFAYQELEDTFGWLSEKRRLEQRLIFGSYPEVINSPGEEKQVLQLLATSYLYKDILMLTQLKKPDLLEKIVQALALQIGSEVSYHEIAQLLGISSETVERYIDLLEKSFVVFRLRSYSNNHRNELKKSQKIYFWDNGIRNAVIRQFNELNLRPDKGALWENYLVSERMKWLSYAHAFRSSWFWRTKQQQEVDYIESYDQKLEAYEFKWSYKGKIPPSFKEAYPQASYSIVSADNYHEFLRLKA